jgi:hypothetical protein
MLKDNTRPQRNIRVAFGDTPLGPWRDISTNLHRKSSPKVRALAQARRRLVNLLRVVWRQALQRDEDARFHRPSRMSASEMTFPEGLKHGTVFVATKKDLGLPLESQHADGRKRRPQVCAEALPGRD